MKDLYSFQYEGKELRESVRHLIVQNHYSQSYRSQQQIHVFTLNSQRNGSIVGVAIFGKPMSRHTDSEHTLELRRFCLIDDTPRNTESYFLSRCLVWLSKNDPRVRQVVTFADPNHGHQGIIYKASNFRYDGEENSSNPRIVEMGARQYHIRQAYAKKDGEYTAAAQVIQDAIKTGNAQVLKQERKLRYIYDIRR